MCVLLPQDEQDVVHVFGGYGAAKRHGFSRLARYDDGYILVPANHGEDPLEKGIPVLPGDFVFVTKDIKVNTTRVCINDEGEEEEGDTSSCVLKRGTLAMIVSIHASKHVDWKGDGRRSYRLLKSKLRPVITAHTTEGMYMCTRGSVCMRAHTHTVLTCRIVGCQVGLCCLPYAVQRPRMG